MKATLDLDLDVLQAAQEFGAARGMTAGEAVSELVRMALASNRTPKVRNGVPMFSPKAGSTPLTMAAVNQLRDEQE